MGGVSPYSSEEKFEYRAPQAGDVRAPCPALNTLANHGYLPRDGKNVTPEMLQRALQHKIGVSWFASKVLVSDTFKKIGHNGVLNLDELARHNVIEHDVSLSRVDAALCDNHQNDFNPARFEKVLTFSKDNQYLTEQDLAEARAFFLHDSKTNNPQYILSDQHYEAMVAETVILLHLLGKQGRISIPDARSFFVEGRFPENWQKHPSFGVLELRPLVKRMSALIKAAKP